MPATTYTGNKFLDLILRGVEFIPPTNVFLALHTGNPGLNGANELSTSEWPAYVRVDCAQGAAIDTGFTAAASKATKNAKQLLFATMDGPVAVTVTHWSIWDAAVGGNCLWAGALEVSKKLDPTDEIITKVNEIELKVE